MRKVDVSDTRALRGVRSKGTEFNRQASNRPPLGTAANVERPSLRIKHFTEVGFGRFAAPFAYDYGISGSGNPQILFPS